MMDKKPLFRIEAAQACQGKWLGDIVLVRPMSFAFMTAISACLAGLIIGFFVIGSYTQRHTVIGKLMPNFGVVTVYAPQPGIVVQKLSREGQVVNQGDTLYLISSDRQGNSMSGVQQSISSQVALRAQSLREELAQTRQLHRTEAEVQRRKVDGLQAEQENVERQVESQEIRVRLSEGAVKRSEQLLAQGFITSEMTQQKQAELIDQRNRLRAIERDQINVRRELLSLRNELISLPLRQQAQQAQIERQFTSTIQEWTESEAKRHFAITAPQSGTVTLVTAEPGQTVDAGKPLLSIVPRGAILEAHLYAPSRAIGFVKSDDKVLLRYHAFPYQKFGHARGIVTSVSRTAMPASEVVGMPNVASSSGEALYRITVKLDRQTLTAFGKEQALQPGMLVEADVLQEKRRLYEWALAPLYSLTGKI